MKTIVSILMGFFLLASSAFGMMATVEITSTNGIIQLSCNSTPVTRTELIGFLGKLATIDKDMTLYVATMNEQVPASALVEILHEIQGTGLHNLVLISPSDLGGKKGHYMITVDATKRKWFGDIGGAPAFESGFHENLLRDPSPSTNENVTTSNRQPAAGDCLPGSK